MTGRKGHGTAFCCFSLRNPGAPLSLPLGLQIVGPDRGRGKMIPALGESQPEGENAGMHVPARMHTGMQASAKEKPHRSKPTLLQLCRATPLSHWAAEVKAGAEPSEAIRTSSRQEAWGGKGRCQRLPPAPRSYTTTGCAWHPEWGGRTSPEVSPRVGVSVAVGGGGQWGLGHQPEGTHKQSINLGDQPACTQTLVHNKCEINMLE